jgi:NAD(P)-dependent dehydrogenase (short-subunit alcohol dehydrogenase family)
MSKYRYAGRTAIITGGGGDIGSCLAGLLVERSMNVVIADRNEHAANYVARDLGDRALPFAGDLADEAEMVRLLDQRHCHHHLGTVPQPVAREHPKRDRHHLDGALYHDPSRGALSAKIR